MDKNIKNLTIAAVIGALILFALPARMGLTAAGVRMLAVFVPTIYLWLTVSPGWSSLISISMIACLLVIDGTATFTGMWGSIYVAVMVPFFMLSTVLEESGAMEWIVKWLISRRFVHGRPMFFTVMFTIALILVSIFIFPMVTAVMFFKILDQISGSIGYTKEDKFYKAMGLLIGWIGQSADGCLIWGRAFMMSMVAFIVGLGFDKLTISDLTLIGIIYLGVLAIAAVLIVKFWIRPDMSKFENYDDAAIRDELKIHPMSKRGKMVVGAMIGVLGVYVLASLKILGPVSDYCTAISIAAPPTLACGVLCLLTADGKPVMDLNEAASKVSWSTVFFLAAIMFYAANFGSEAFGITVFLQNVFASITNLPTILMFLVGLTIASLLTNFASNAVSCIAVNASFVPVMLASANVNRGQVLAFAVCLIPICGTAICTKSACATMGVVYCDDGIEYKGTAKYSAALCAIMVLFCCFILIPLGQMLLANVV